MIAICVAVCESCLAIAQCPTVCPRSTMSREQIDANDGDEAVKMERKKRMRQEKKRGGGGKLVVGNPDKIIISPVQLGRKGKKGPPPLAPPPIVPRTCPPASLFSSTSLLAAIPLSSPSLLQPSPQLTTPHQQPPGINHKTGLGTDILNHMHSIINNTSYHFSLCTPLYNTTLQPTKHPLKHAPHIHHHDHDPKHSPNPRRPSSYLFVITQ